jgi:tetrapyrrole methylase family protein/MazG family protein
MHWKITNFMNTPLTNPSGTPGNNSDAMQWPDDVFSQELANTDLVIAGLGPGELGEIPLASWYALQKADRVFVHAGRHPSVQAIGDLVSVTVLNGSDETPADEQPLQSQTVDSLLAAAGQGRLVVYATPGHPWAGEPIVQQVLLAAKERGLRVRIVGGASFIEPAFGAVHVDPARGSQVVEATVVADQYHPKWDVSLPVLIGRLHSRELAAGVMSTLLNAYPRQHQVTLIEATGSQHQRTTTFPLCELIEQEDFTDLTCLYVPPAHMGSFTDLQEIVAHLRAPDGCPWDREQTLESLRSDLLDETSEVLEAIDEADNGHVAEELGDLLMVATMMVQIATEEGRFQMADVVRRIVQKLIRRHPHVFGDVVVNSVDEVFVNWDAIKAQEREDKGHPPAGSLDGVSASLPALEKARKLQSKAKKAGLLDRAKLASENPALIAALGPDPDDRALGRLLWQIVALASEQGLNAEDALRGYLVHFRKQHESG